MHLSYQTNLRERFTVIDEADELLSSGWEEAMEKLFQGSGRFSYLNFPIVMTDAVDRYEPRC